MFLNICSFTENRCLTLCQDTTASSGANRDPVMSRKLKIFIPRNLSGPRAALVAQARPLEEGTRLPRQNGEWSRTSLWTLRTQDR